MKGRSRGAAFFGWAAAGCGRDQRVDEVLAMTKRAEITRMGFVGNEAYAQF